MRSLLFAALLFVLAVPTAPAQESSASNALRVEPAQVHALLPGTNVDDAWAASARLEGRLDTEAEKGSRLSFLGSTSVIHALGGAMVGAWIGYFTSQLVVSDWDGGAAIDRAAWAAGGAVVGSLSGLAVSGVITPGGPGGYPKGIHTRGRSVINTAELRQAGRQNLHEVVSALRPEWLIIRGVHSLRETPKGGSVGQYNVAITDPGKPTILVYQDGARLGGVEVLREFSPAEVTTLEFLNPAKASQAFGAGHTHGAIVISKK